jgi:hypothetical protein
MGVAFEITRAALRLTDRDDPVVAMVAKRIIELAKAGEHNPDLLCERVLNDLRALPGQNITVPPRNIIRSARLTPITGSGPRQAPVAERPSLCSRLQTEGVNDAERIQASRRRIFETRE